MKKNFLIVLITVFALGFYSCDDDDPIVTAEISGVSVNEDSPIYAGDNVEVKWVSKNSDVVSIELWSNLDSEWIVLENSVSGSDTMVTVAIPSDALTDSNYKIKVADVSSSVEAESSVFEIVGLQARTESISTTAGYANDVYYSLAKGVVSEVSRTNWDVAFSVNKMSSSILINDGAAVKLKVYPISANWNWEDAIDTTGYSSWDFLYNSEEDWEDDAFVQNATGHPNYGWGEYNEISHFVEGDALYIMQLTNGDFKRIFIEIKNYMTGEYKFKYSNIDGSNEVSETISFSDATSNYVYYSIVDGAVVDREPDADTWDLLFTKYYSASETYFVTGVKQNFEVLAIDKSNVDVNSVTFTEDEFGEEMNIIGSDWKSFSMQTFSYVLEDDRAFIVKNRDGKNFQIVFKTFEGSSTGNLSFDIKPIL